MRRMLILLAVVAVAATSGCIWNIGSRIDGEAEDKVIRVYREGRWCPTWTVQMGGSIPGQHDRLYYGADEGVVSDLKAAQDDGYNVRFYWKGTGLVYSVCDYSYPEVIYKVERV